MTGSNRPNPSLTPEVRTGLFYFTMFGAPGVLGAYFAIWLAGQGIGPGDIGMINSMPIFIMLVLNLVVGRIADRARDWRTVIIAGCVLAGIMPIALFAVEGFWGILIVWTLSVIPFASIAPVIDAATVRMTRRRGSSFAPIRAWGTIGYMVWLAATGYIVALLGEPSFLYLLVFVCLLRAVVSLQLPHFRAPEGQAPQPVVAAARRLGEVLKPWFLLPLLGFATVQSTLMILNTFAALVWKDAGISPAVIGPLLALGALSEVVVMFVFGHIARRFTARHLILIATLVSVVRWTVMAFDPPVEVLALLQLTHGICFGFGYLGVVNFIANWTGEDMAAEAQSLAVVMQQGMSVLSVFAFGFLLEIMDGRAFLAAAMSCLIASGFVVASLRLRRSGAETEGGPAR